MSVPKETKAEFCCSADLVSPANENSERLKARKSSNRIVSFLVLARLNNRISSLPNRLSVASAGDMSYCIC
jgi:hypothetical protein